MHESGTVFIPTEYVNCHVYSVSSCLGTIYNYTDICDCPDQKRESHCLKVNLLKGTDTHIISDNMDFVRELV